MLQEQFEVLGFWGDYVYFRFQGKIIQMVKKLPKEDLILKLKVEPEDVKALRDEILVNASLNPLSYQDKEDLLKQNYGG